MRQVLVLEVKADEFVVWLETLVQVVRRVAVIEDVDELDFVKLSSFLCHVVSSLQVEFEEVWRDITIGNGMYFQRFKIHELCQENHNPVVVGL